MQMVQEGIQDLLKRVTGNVHKANLEAAYANDPIMFQPEFFSAIHRLAKSEKLLASNFSDLATIMTSRTFTGYASKVSKDEELQFDALFTAYFTALASKFNLPPRTLKDRILSLVKIKIEVNDSGLTFCNSARINFKVVDENRKQPINNSFDLISKYMAVQTLSAATPVTVGVTTQTTQITWSDGMASKLVIGAIQYNQLTQDDAAAANKDINSWIKSVPFTSSSNLKLKEDSDEDSSDEAETVD